MPDNLFASPILGKVLIVGRLVCASVEFWVLYTYMKALLVEDAKAHARAAADQ